MAWLPTAVMLIVLALVMVQGALLLFSRKSTAGQRWSGSLNLLLAVSGFVAYLLFASGSLIISPEYSVILAEGTSAWIWCLAIIVLIPFALWMVLCSTRLGH